jgi:hypothetical protein
MVFDEVIFYKVSNPQEIPPSVLPGITYGKIIEFQIHMNIKTLNTFKVGVITQIQNTN